MRGMVSLDSFEDFLEDADPKEVARRIMRLIAAVLPTANVAPELLGSWGALPEHWHPNLKEIDDYVENYEEESAEDHSFWLATAILCTLGLNERTNEDYEETVVYISDCLKYVGCSEQQFYQVVIYDFSEQKILRLLSSGR